MPAKRKAPPKAKAEGTPKKGRGRPKKKDAAAEEPSPSKEEAAAAETGVGSKAEAGAEEAPSAVKPEKEEAAAGKAEVGAETRLKKGESRLLETGHIYFFYRPRVAVEEVSGPEDVARLYVLLAPGLGEKEAQQRPKRLIIVGKKKLPDTARHERLFGFVYKVSYDLKELHSKLQAEEYDTLTRGHRTVGAARPAGEGVYGIIEHGTHTHLAYVLELPEQPGEVQQAFNIVKEGSYILTVKNPDRGPPLGLRPQNKAKFSDELRKVLNDYAWVPAKPVEFLDYEGCEIALIGASDDLRKEFGALGRELEDLEIKDVEALPGDDKLYLELHMSKKEFPPEPLHGEFK